MRDQSFEPPARKPSRPRGLRVPRRLTLLTQKARAPLVSNLSASVHGGAPIDHARHDASYCDQLEGLLRCAELAQALRAAQHVQLLRTPRSARDRYARLPRRFSAPRATRRHRSKCRRDTDERAHPSASVAALRLGRRALRQPTARRVAQRRETAAGLRALHAPGRYDQIGRNDFPAGAHRRRKGVYHI